MHFGHLLAAQDAYEQHRLDRLIFVPAAQAPLKPNDVQSSAVDRLAMLRSAIEWDRRFEISDVELLRGGVSYTIDSARHFRALNPGRSRKMNSTSFASSPISRQRWSFGNWSPPMIQ